MISNRTFIALTQNKDFWRSTNNIVALGTWCIDDISNHKEYRDIITYPIHTNKSSFLNFKISIDDLYIKNLNILVIYLNEQHQTKHSIRYWDIVLGPFLYKYIGIMYERYLTISSLINTYHDFDTIVMDPGSYHKGGYVDTTSLLKKTQFDDHNLEIYSKLLAFFGKNFPTKKIKRREYHPPHSKNQYSKLIIELLLNSMSSIKFNKKRIFMQNSYFDYISIIKFVLLSKFRIKVKLNEYKQNSYPIFNKSKRNILKDKLTTDTHFEKFIKETLPFDLPMCYLENYEYIVKLSKKNYPTKKLEIIYSSNSWYYDEIFKVWAAGNIENSILIGSQHGGNYGVVEYLFEEEFERRISDHYVTWGWGEKTKTLHPIGSSKLWNYKQAKKTGSSEVLFSMTIKPKFFSDLRRLPEENMCYLQDHKKFLNNISPQVLHKIRIRPYNADTKIEIIKLWREYNKNIVVEGWNIKFIDSLKNCRLFICDHIMTTYLESLKMNIPTIIYINSDYPNGALRREVQADFQKLKDVGILYNSMEEMAIALNETYINIDDWWNEKKLQQVRHDFCEKFALSSNFMIKDWDDAFMEIIAEN